MATVKKRRKLSTKITLMFLVLLVIMMAAIGYVAYQTSYNSVLNDYNSIGESAGILAADIIDTDKIDDWLTNGADEQYVRIESLLKTIKRSNGLTYLYASIPVFDEAGNMVNDTVYLFDAMLEGEDPMMFGTLGEHSGAVDVYEQCRYLYENNVTIKSDVITSSEFGWLLSVYVPMCGSEGLPVGWIGVDIDMTELVHSIARETIVLVSLICALVTVFAVIFILYFRRGVVQPVKELSTNMTRFVRGSDKLEYRAIESISTNDEIEQMADDFNSMAKSLLEYTDNLEKSTMEKERMRADLDVAAQIRASLSGGIGYPAFPDRTEFELCASMKNTIFNKSSFCDCFFTDEHTLFLVVGESAGSSLASMLYAMLAATNIRCFARMGYQPYRIAAETNNQLAGGVKGDKELTVEALIVQLDLRDGAVKYVNAGMPPILVKGTGESFTYENTPVGFNLGEMPGVSFTQEMLHLSQGNMLLMMSNGVPGMKNESGLEFTQSYVQSGINEITTKVYDLREMTEQLETMLADFRGGAELESDTSMILLRYFG